MADDGSSSFESMKVPELQNFLKARGIQVASDGRKMKRAELQELCKNAAEMKVSKVDEEIELKDDFIKSKITLPGGKLLPHPHSLQFWTHNFTNIPDFRFPDIYHYLVGKDGYDEACLRSYKSLQGFRLYMDGHVENLKYHSILDAAGYCCFQFKVKPTKRFKTEEGRDHYWGFLVLEISGSIYSAFCACKGG
ncbi:uncharacterized protein LOC141886303 [Acropora palmata]|uniref:uncharacterized protein LOC141886303 n=1 Tax=Acropora palmata TaxID=6131 RepID=UPI003DA15EF0